MPQRSCRPQNLVIPAHAQGRFAWEYADPRTAAERLTRAGFTDVETSLEEAPAVLASAGAYGEFIRDVILRHHQCIPTPALRHTLIEKLVEQAATDHPPFSLDYRRLNMRAQKARQAGYPVEPSV